jgi:hypothetical protein
VGADAAHQRRRAHEQLDRHPSTNQDHSQR